ncbi:hypothetical protein [Bacillus cereus]|jgi:hypothetical protein|uniref:hypothetical protein n=1 Tax=Bacillus cereus TaxID=1396 RepID=UPI001F2DC7F4|nr:hypothetical protein [Bacillus cereus]BCC56614.1 hypothetical protein BCJMU07_p313 [Bacillus cereus]BCD32877.1 hypothetical protein BC30102_p306 [Bacillus cereus]
MEYRGFSWIGYWEGNENIEVVKMEDGKVFALCEWNGKGYINCWRCTGRSHKNVSKERYTIVPTYRKVNGYEYKDWVEVASYQVYEN